MSKHGLAERHAVRVQALHEPDEHAYYRCYAAEMADGCLQILTAFRDGGDDGQDWDRDHERFSAHETLKLAEFLYSMKPVKHVTEHDDLMK